MFGTSERQMPMIYVIPDIYFLDFVRENDYKVAVIISGTGTVYDGKKIVGTVDKSSVVPNCRPNYYAKTGYYVITFNSFWYGYPPLHMLGEATIVGLGTHPAVPTHIPTHIPTPKHTPAPTHVHVHVPHYENYDQETVIETYAMKPVVEQPLAVAKRIEQTERSGNKEHHPHHKKKRHVKYNSKGMAICVVLVVCFTIIALFLVLLVVGLRRKNGKA
jgi:hypothetical protein